MDLKQLEYFVKIAEAQSFSRAAGQLNVAQSALSRQVRLLEDELDVELLIRHGRGAELTPAGERLLEQAQGLLRHADQVRDNVIAEATEPRGELLIGIPADLATNVGAELLAELHKRYPRILAKSIVGTTVVMQELLAAGQLNIAILGVRGTEEDILDLEYIRPAQLHLVGGPGSLSRFGKDVSLDQLLDLPFIMTARTAAIRGLEHAAQTAGSPLKIVTETNYFPLAIELLHRNIGYTIWPIEVIAKDLNAGRLEAIPVRELHFRWSIGRPKFKALTPAIRAAQELIRELLTRPGTLAN